MFARLILLALVCSTLAGCIVAPARPYYGGGGYYGGGYARPYYGGWGGYRRW
jgi:hypothetical protein